MRARNVMALSKDTWQQGFWRDAKKGRQGQEGFSEVSQGSGSFAMGIQDEAVVQSGWDV